MTQMPKIRKPDPELLSSRARHYIDQAPGETLDESYRAIGEETKALVSRLTEAEAEKRYAPGKWSVKELLLHVVDCERLQSCRALWLAREPGIAIPGFEENIFAEHARADRRSLVDILDEYDAVRAATLTLIRSISEEDIDTLGRVDHLVASPRSILWMTPGHEKHHLKVLLDRYGLKSS